MTGRTAAALAVSLVLATLVFAIAAQHFEPRQFVYDIATPPFDRIALPSPLQAVEAMESHLHRMAGQGWVRQLAPNQGGALWIAILVLVVAGLDRQPWSARTRDLLLMQVVGWLLFGTIDILEESKDPAFLRWIRLMFELIGIVTATLWVRTFWLQKHPYRRPWTPAAGHAALAALAGALVMLNLFVVFLQVPDDSSFFANLGAQRLRERGRLPYGDPMLTGTPGAAYPPLLYVLHAGVQAGIGFPINDPVEDRPRVGLSANYVEPPRVATQIVLAMSHLAGVAALWLIGRSVLGETGAWAVVALYAGSSYLLGVGGVHESTNGLTFVSHVVPASASLVAFASLSRPALNGVLLAVATGLGFYPAFFFPVWAAWHLRRERADALRFAAAFAFVCALIAVFVWTLSAPAPGLGLLATIVRDTLGHHSDPNGYGLSLYGLWGQQTGVLGWVNHPLWGSSALTTPFFALFAASLLLASVLAQRADVPRLALLTAGAAIGANLWKIHATATYVAWYYPFLLVGILALGTRQRTVEGKDRI